MHRRVALGVALVGVLGLVVAAPGAGAAAKRSHVIDSTIAAAVVGGSPTGKAVVAGTVSDARFGDGATVYRTQPPANGVQQSSFTAFFSNGTFKGKATVRLTPQSDGSVRLDGAGAITGGTGRYKGAKGKLDLVGTSSAQGVITFTAKGSARY